jgi:hypothetical protein
MKKKTETTQTRNRFRLITGQDFVGDVDAREMRKFGFGNVRSFDDYLAFSGVTFEEGKKDNDTCRQLHWVPYRNATEVELIVGGGWKLHPAVAPPVPEVRTLPNPNGPDEPVQPQGADMHAKAGAGAEADTAAEALPVDAKNKKTGAAAGVPVPPKSAENGVGGVMFYVFIFGGCVYVIMANDGVRWRISNLWQTSKPLDSRA